MESFTPGELRTLRSLKTPEKIQGYLDGLKYHLGDTSYSPRRVMQERTAHCLEGAVFAAAALRVNGRPPWIMDLEAARDSDHVIAVFKEGRTWGAIAVSNFAGLRYRPPVYRNLRELALSYFNDYFNYRRERTLRTFSRPVNLSRFDSRGWMTSAAPIWYIPEYLCEIPHTNLLDARMESTLPLIDPRSFRSGTWGVRR